MNLSNGNSQQINLDDKVSVTGGFAWNSDNTKVVFASGYSSDNIGDAIEVFNKHIEEVKRTVLQECLLIFEVRQGWEPLCAFLNVPVPTHKPFPHVNDGARWKWLLRYREIMIWGIIISIVGLLI